MPSRATIANLTTRGFERLALWPRGVDCRHFRPDRPGRERVRAALGIRPEQIVVGHVSRIAAEKNVDYLATALERLIRRSDGQLRILIVGDGPARGDLEARLGPAVHCVGYKTGDDLADHYAACDLFAFASTTETFGNVILEAMASGLPVVALRAGGPGEIVDSGRTGILVEPHAPPEVMAEALAHLLTNSGTRHLMARDARAFAETQSWEAVMQGLRARYERVAGESRARGAAGFEPTH